MAPNVLARVARQSLEGAVDVAKRVVGIADDDALVAGVEHAGGCSHALEGVVQFGDVADVAVPGHAAVGAWRRRRGAFHPAQPQFGMVHAVGFVPGFEPARRLPDRLPYSLDIVGVDRLEGRLGVGDHIFGRTAKDFVQPLGGKGKMRRAIGPEPELIDYAGHVARKFVEALEPFIALFLGGSALGHVEVRAVHPLRLAVARTRHHPATVEDPHPVPRLVAQAQLHLVVVGFAPEVLLQPLVALDQVVGVGQLLQGIDGGRLELGQRVADDLGPAFVVAGLAGLHVPFPGAGARTVQNARQSPVRPPRLTSLAVADQQRDQQRHEHYRQQRGCRDGPRKLLQGRLPAATGFRRRSIGRRHEHRRLEGR